MARVTLKTVAEAVGVSPMTVSNAFSRPDQLSAVLRTRILAAAAELGYAGPDPAARSLARGATGTVGILSTDSSQYAFTDEHSTVFLAAIADELGRTGVALTLLPPGSAGAVVPTRDVAMDGAIVYSCRPASDGVDWLRKRGLPRVLVDALPEDGVPSVNVDDRGGARSAAQHLVDLGHRRIAVVVLGTDTADPADFYPSRERMRGWREVFDGAGIEPVVLGCAASSVESGAAAGRDLAALPERPTAVLCVSDAVAAGVLDAVQDAGLRVPEDLSVVGFDDTALAARTRPALTTVHQDTPGKGRAVAAALVAAIAAARAGTDLPPQHVVLPTELVVRASTAPPSMP